METILLIALSVIMAGVFLWLVFANRYPKMNPLFWLVIVVALSVIIIQWLSYFFPEMYFEGTVTGINHKLAVMGKINLVTWVMFAFFLWMYLYKKPSELSFDKITSFTARWAATFLIALVFLVTMMGAVMRYTSSCVVTETQDEMIPKVDQVFIADDVTSKNVFPDIDRLTSEDIFGKTPPNVVIPKGGSLCGTLGVTKEYALVMAKMNNMKYRRFGNTLIVDVQPGDSFMPIGQLWAPLKKKGVTK